MEQSEGSSSPGDQDHSGRQEVVFVLRVRADEAGWRGQVHRLDVGSLRYVANHSDLFAMLAGDWDLVVNASPNEEQSMQE